MNNNIADTFSFSSFLDSSACIAPLAWHQALLHSGMFIRVLNKGKDNEQRKLVIKPKEAKYKSLPGALKARVQALLAVCDVGFAYNAYVVIHSSDSNGTGTIKTFRNLAALREYYNDWKVNGSGTFIFLDCVRSGHGDTWEVVVEAFEKLSTIS